MRCKALVVLAALAGLSAFPCQAASPEAQARERHLLAQMSVPLRGWLRIEGRREAMAGAPSEQTALAAVRERFPDLSNNDAETLAFVVLMVAERDVTQAPADGATPAAATSKTAPALGQALSTMFQKISDTASDVVRDLI
jgi:hypothetical protein